MKKRRLYLIHPKPPDIYCDIDLIPGIAGTASNSLVTVAALAPADKFDVTLCDEYVSPVDFDTPADFVGITAKNGQGPRMYEVAREFRRRGVPVIFGGPHPSLNPEEVREHCDVLVLGELESIAERFFDDLYSGQYQKEYLGTRAALSESPIPRWDLYPNDRTMYGSLQTSRGCPFECEFCDVIQYAGRKQRHKDVGQVLAELEVLYAHGYRDVFLADDNLTVFRRRAKELLRALADWNAKAPEPVSFYTQLSIEISDDAEMLELLAAAYVRQVFIGIESTNQSSLLETKKRQNVGIDLVERTDRFARAGIQISAGLIVGFDSDGPDIFEQHLAFAQQTSIANFQLSQLYASHATPLRQRLAAAGRLRPEYDQTAFGLYTNLEPLQMSLEELSQGSRWLMRELYEPENFVRRLLKLVDLFPAGANFRPRSLTKRPVVVEVSLASQQLLTRSPETRAAVKAIRQALQKKPAARETALHALMWWARRRSYIEQRMAKLAEQPRPPKRAASSQAVRALPVLR